MTWLNVSTLGGTGRWFQGSWPKPGGSSQLKLANNGDTSWDTGIFTSTFQGLSLDHKTPRTYSMDPGRLVALKTLTAKNCQKPLKSAP